MMMMGRFLRIAFLGWLVLAVIPSRAAAPAIGEPAPVLKATKLDGKLFDLAAERGKVVIVNFWATWCLPCRAEMPALDSFYRLFRERGLVMIGISVDRWADRGKVGALMQQYSYPAAMINELQANDFPRPREIPITYVIDRAGILRAVLRPGRIAVTPKTLAETVLPLLLKHSAPHLPGVSAAAD